MKELLPMPPTPISNFITHSRLSLAFAITLALLSPLRAQSAAPAHGSTMAVGTMAERHQAMQSQREMMMAEMKQQDTELSAQLARIKSASKAQKVDLLVAVVARMVEQRAAMHAQMDAMMKEMMAVMPMAPGSMSSQPMMNDMPSQPAGMMEKKD